VQNVCGYSSAAGHAEVTGESGESLFDDWQRPFDISISKYEMGSLAAQFEADTLEVDGGRLRNLLADLAAAGEADHRYLRRRDEQP
jgi:hypothetical protein